MANSGVRPLKFPTMAPSFALGAANAVGHGLTDAMRNYQKAQMMQLQQKQMNRKMDIAQQNANSLQGQRDEMAHANAIKSAGTSMANFNLIKAMNGARDPQTGEKLVPDDMANKLLYDQLKSGLKDMTPEVATKFATDFQKQNFQQNQTEFGDQVHMNPDMIKAATADQGQQMRSGTSLQNNQNTVGGAASRNAATNAKDLAVAGMRNGGGAKMSQMDTINYNDAKTNLDKAHDELSEVNKPSQFGIPPDPSFVKSRTAYLQDKITKYQSAKDSLDQKYSQPQSGASSSASGASSSPGSAPPSGAKPAPAGGAPASPAIPPLTGKQLPASQAASAQPGDMVFSPVTGGYHVRLPGNHSDGGPNFSPNPVQPMTGGSGPLAQPSGNMPTPAAAVPQAAAPASADSTTTPPPIPGGG